MPTDEEAKLTRPIIGIENRTPQEAFDIMCDRIRSALTGASAVGEAAPFLVSSSCSTSFLDPMGWQMTTEREKVNQAMREALAAQDSDDSEPVAWVSRSTLNRLHSNGSHVGTHAALFRDQLKSGNGVALYTHPSPSISDEMVERVARAIAASEGWEMTNDISLGYVPGSRVGKAMNQARVALEAALSTAPKDDEWQPIDIDYLRETLAWIRRNFTGGSTKQVREQIDLALEHLIAAAPTKGGE